MRPTLILRLIYLSLGLLLFVTACNSMPQVPTIPVTTVVTPTLTSEGNNSGQTLATSNPALLSSLSTVTGDKGIVVGRAYRLDGTTAITMTPAYLAKVYWNNDHTQGVFALDINAAPKTQTQSNGDFMFTDVDDGEYTFVVGTPDHYTAVLSKPDGSVSIFTVTSGKTTSLDAIKLDFKP